MRILQHIPICKPEAGGPARSVPAMCRSLARAGEEVTPVSAEVDSNWPIDLSPAKPLTTLPLDRSLPDRLAELVSETHTDILHDHGLWRRGNRAVSLVAKRLNRPVILSTRGMLDPISFGQKKWKKRLGWIAFQGRNLRRAAILHVTSDAEAEHIRAHGLTGPIAVIPNGVEIPVEAPSPPDHAPPAALYLGRIHRQKRLDMLLDAWAQARPTGWKLIVAGPDEQNMVPQLQSQADRLGISDIEFLPAQNEREKWALYRRASLMVLPSPSENFGLVVAEALAAARPAIATHGAPWQDLIDHHCGWWVQPTAAALAEAIRKATSCSPLELDAMGTRGRNLIREQYTWDSIAERFAAVYQWILTGQNAPPCLQA